MTTPSKSDDLQDCDPVAPLDDRDLEPPTGSPKPAQAKCEPSRDVTPDVTKAVPTGTAPRYLPPEECPRVLRQLIPGAWWQHPLRIFPGALPEDRIECFWAKAVDYLSYRGNVLVPLSVLTRPDPAPDPNTLPSLPDTRSPNSPNERSEAPLPEIRLRTTHFISSHTLKRLRDGGRFSVEVVDADGPGDNALIVTLHLKEVLEEGAK